MDQGADVKLIDNQAVLVRNGMPLIEDPNVDFHDLNRAAILGSSRSASRRMIVMYFLLFYEVVDDYIERRRAFREEHLGLAQEAKERGELVLAGA